MRHCIELFYLACTRLHCLLASIASMVALTIAAVVRSIQPPLHVLASVDAISYRLGRALKPVYRQSYDTHGLSLGFSRGARC